MPIIRKNVPNWYNSIPEEKSSAFGEHFDPRRLKTNEIECGDAVLAKIPNLPGKISRRNRQNGDFTTRYIELILEHSYDKEKKQSRNKRVIIGTDVSHIYRGMMIINEKYHDYFDKQGNLIYKQEEPTSDTQAQSSESPQTKDSREPSAPQESPAEQNPQIRYAADGNADVTKDDIKEAPEDEPKEGPDKNTDEDTNDNEEEDEEYAEDDEIIAMLQETQRRKDRLEYLTSILAEYRHTIDEQAKRRPDKP